MTTAPSQAAYMDPSQISQNQSEQLPAFVEPCLQAIVHPYYGNTHFVQPLINDAVSSAGSVRHVEHAEHHKQHASDAANITSASGSVYVAPSKPAVCPTTNTDENALLLALTTNDLPTVKRLVLANSNSSNTAVASGNIQEGANIAAVDVNSPITVSGISALHVAASKGFPGVIMLLLGIPGVILDIHDHEQETPLFKATYNGHVVGVRMLIDAGANISHQDSQGWTSLHNAASQGHAEVTRILTASCPQCINLQSKSGFTSLMSASARGSTEIASILLDAGADPLLVNSSLDTAHDIALYNEHYALAEMISKAEKHWLSSHAHLSSRKYPVHQAEMEILYENQRSSSVYFPVQMLQATPENLKFGPTNLAVGDPAPITAFPPHSHIPSGFKNVHLPLGISAEGQTTRQWFWLTEWRVNTTDPRLLIEGSNSSPQPMRNFETDLDSGWLYARSFDTPESDWTATMESAPSRSSTVANAEGVVSPRTSSTGMFGLVQSILGTTTSGWVRRRSWVRIRKRRFVFDGTGGVESIALPRDTQNDSVDPNLKLPALEVELDTLKCDIESLMAQSSIEYDVRRKAIIITQVKLQLDRAEELQALIDVLKGDTPHSQTLNSTAMKPRMMQAHVPSMTSISGVWQKDSEASTCFNCVCKFTFMLRRHHCRRCGNIFCDGCSSRRVMIPISMFLDDNRTRNLSMVLSASNGDDVGNSDQPNHGNSGVPQSDASASSVSDAFHPSDTNHSGHTVISVSEPPSSATPLAAGGPASKERVCDACYVVLTTSPESYLPQLSHNRHRSNSNHSIDARHHSDTNAMDTPNASKHSGSLRPYSRSQHRLSLSGSIMAECPVCQKVLVGGMSESDVEAHVAACLESVARSLDTSVMASGEQRANATASADVARSESTGIIGRSMRGVSGNRYIVQVLASTLPDVECTICMEEFEKGQRIARLNCLCMFHYHCIQEWFANPQYGKQMCPVHFKFTD
ncbi:hypothetical protein BASA61_009366 [Batrachochytrium salamandrivorans]|nr:hypothetical protein BASA61_009366 [Batrachochytrium salamandrivorans]